MAGKVGSEFQINTYTPAAQWSPSVASLTSGGFVVTWESTSGDGDRSVVYGRISVPCLIANSLSINEGETVSLTTAILDVNDWIGSSDAALIFTVTNIQHGFFDRLSKPSVEITSFTLEEIKNSQICFIHDNSGIAPAYDVKVTNGGAETTYQPAIVFYTNIIPVLQNNQLTVNEGETVILTSSMLSASDVDTDNAFLTFTVTNVQNGQFEKVSNPWEPITTFTQQEIIDGDIQFAHDGSEIAPSYSVKVSDGNFESEFYPSSIDFHYEKPTNFLPYAIGGGVAAGIVACAATSIAVAIGVGFFVSKRSQSKKITSSRKRTQ